MAKAKVCIIGGTGHMGRFFRRFFEKNGCKVMVASRKTRLKPSDCVKQSDIVMISVPIASTVNVIRNVAPYISKSSLLIDTTSIKEAPVKAMLRYSKSEVIGMHPVFGPNVKSMKSQTIVLCPARTKRWLKWLVGIFGKNGAKIKISTPEKHDEMMSVIQGLNHFSTLAVAHAMKSLGTGIRETLEYTSPVYRLRMAMVGRILNQSPDLYAGIEIMNPKNRKAIEALEKSSKKLRKIIEEKNAKELVRYFNECAEFFGGFRKEAEKMSDYLIEQMVDI